MMEVFAVSYIACFFVAGRDPVFVTSVDASVQPLRKGAV